MRPPWAVRFVPTEQPGWLGPWHYSLALTSAGPAPTHPSLSPTKGRWWAQHTAWAVDQDRHTLHEAHGKTHIPHLGTLRVQEGREWERQRQKGRETQRWERRKDWRATKERSRTRTHRQRGRAGYRPRGKPLPQAPAHPCTLTHPRPAMRALTDVPLNTLTSSLSSSHTPVHTRGHPDTHMHTATLPPTLQLQALGAQGVPRSGLATPYRAEQHTQVSGAQPHHSRDLHPRPALASHL